jgi:hypothetical protein
MQVLPLTPAVKTEIIHVLWRIDIDIRFTVLLQAKTLFPSGEKKFLEVVVGNGCSECCAPSPDHICWLLV